MPSRLVTLNGRFMRGLLISKNFKSPVLIFFFFSENSKFQTNSKMGPGEYESIRLKNLEDNKRVLAAFGLMNPFKPAQCVIKKTKRSAPKPTPTKKRALPTEEALTAGSILYGTRRKSARLDGKTAGEGLDLGSTYDKLEEGEKEQTRVPADRPNFYGPVPGVEVGTEWTTRMECCRDGVHRPTVAGIHGGQDGAYSIALSGGYEDDVDLGDCFTYTGEGGRDLKGTKAKPKNLRTAPQSKDQTLTRGNLALSRSVETKNPVRVIRGYKLCSQFAPEDGYRYDGIYTVEKFWFTVGLSGYGVWKFALKRCPDQAPSPWQFIQDCNSSGQFEDTATLPSENEKDGKKKLPCETPPLALSQCQADSPTQEDEQDTVKPELTDAGVPIAQVLQTQADSPTQKDEQDTVKPELTDADVPTAQVSQTQADSPTQKDEQDTVKPKSPEAGTHTAQELPAPADSHTQGHERGIAAPEVSDSKTEQSEKSVADGDTKDGAEAED